MKKTFAIFGMALLLMSFMAAFVLADDEVNTSDNAVVASSDNVDVESADLGKAERWLNRVERRANRMERLAENGNYDAAARIARRNEALVDRAQTYLEAKEENGEAINTKKALAATVALQDRIEAHQARSLEVKERILEEKGDELTEEQLQHLEEVFSNIEERSQLRIEAIEQRQENLKLKYKATTGMTDEEVEAALSEFDHYLEQRRELRQEMIQEFRAEDEALRNQTRERIMDLESHSDDSEDNTSVDSSDDDSGQGESSGEGNSDSENETSA